MMLAPVSPGEQLRDAALSLVGTPFRLHGRDPETGLDCAGLVLCALERIGRPLPPPAAYSRHWQDLDGISMQAKAAGLVSASPIRRTGDVLIMRVSSIQLHVLIAASGSSAIHAHAGLGRVVLSPIPADWSVAVHLRLPHP